jgi:hypothetical protein
MAITRPNVIVYQEYQNITVAPDIPDLNVLIVGPAYQLLDYLDDKADCYAGVDYGTLNIEMDDYGTPSEVDISDPPNIKPGGVLDDDSVRVFLDDLRAVISLASSPGTDDGTFWGGDNLFIGGTALGTGTNFNAIHVAAGDHLIAETGAATSDAIKVVKELAFVLKRSGGAAIDFQAAGVVAGDTVQILEDTPIAPAVSRDGFYTVKKQYVENGLVVTDAIELEDASNLVGTNYDCHIRVTSPGGTVKIDTTAGAKVTIQDWCALRTTTDFDADNDPVPANREWRIERELDDQELDSSYFSIDAITGVITVGTPTGIQVAVTEDIGNKPVSYGKIYIEYKALRTDLQNLQEISSTAQMTTELDKYDARNPLFVGAYVAATNTTTPVQVYGVKSDDSLGYADFIERISDKREVYAIVPLTYDSTILGMLKVMAENYADPTYVLDNGIRQKFRVIIGAVELTTQRYVSAEIGGATTAQKDGTAPTALGDRTCTLAITSGNPVTTGSGDLGTDLVVPGCTMTMRTNGVVYPTTGEYKIAHVNSDLSFEVSSESGEPALPATVALILNDYIEIKNAAGAVIVRWDNDPTAGPPADTFTITNAVLDKLYLVLNCPTATFISDGVVPGDLLQIPADPEDESDWTGYQSWVINSVDSETRLEVVNNGTNSPTVANELPHGIKRSATPTDRTVDAGSVWLRIFREMTKDEQVTYMVQIATGYSSKRMILAYPSEVDVTDLVDGSKDRGDDTDPVAADAQPGYYLSCAIGGMTAGYPPQQGFTNIGINGIDRIYKSSDYFEERQLTDLSNGGVYVFVQDNPDALPYSIHEVTTDILALETAEYMVVKDFDFISWTFLDTLFPFLGKWNINDDTIGFVRQALYSTIANLKSRYVARIGAPLIGATVDNVFQASDISKDRLEAYVSVDLPMTLNVIGLHLVA